MEELKNRVKALESEYDEGRQIELLQKIGGLILKRYIIEVGNLITEPLLVEAYYYAEGKFEDENTHGFKSPKAAERQADNFGGLYVHRRGYGGIDVCLSLKTDYCLSFLIKNSLVYEKGGTEKKFCTQVSLLRYLKESSGEADFIEQNGMLTPSHEKAFSVVNTVRKGVAGKFKDAPLAFVPLEAVRDYPLTLAAGHGKKALAAEYFKKEFSLASDDEAKRISAKFLKGSLKGGVLYDNER